VLPSAGDALLSQSLNTWQKYERCRPFQSLDVVVRPPIRRSSRIGRWSSDGFGMRASAHGGRSAMDSYPQDGNVVAAVASSAILGGATPKGEGL
jgi:hypothetical protein